jgi:hypothetical protein
MEAFITFKPLCEGGFRTVYSSMPIDASTQKTFCATTFEGDDIPLNTPFIGVAIGDLLKFSPTGSGRVLTVRVLDYRDDALLGLVPELHTSLKAKVLPDWIIGKANALETKLFSH